MLSINELDPADRYRFLAELLERVAARHREAAYQSLALGDPATAELERWEAQLVDADAEQARNRADAEERLARKRIRAARRDTGGKDRTDPDS